jgi:ubiquitin C-terminal hydrolase
MAEELQLDSPFASPVDPREVKDAMDARTDRFAGYEQRDAHEFMGELVDAIHEELQLDQMQSETDLSQVRLPTDDFRMTVHKILKCESCGYDR